MSKEQTLRVRVTTELMAALDVAAERVGRSRSDYVRDTLLVDLGRRGVLGGGAAGGAAGEAGDESWEMT